MSEPRAPSPESRASNLQPPTSSLYACVYAPAAAGEAADRSGLLRQIAAEFSPRFERHGSDIVVIDIRGLERLLGSARTIGEELRRDAASRGLRVHVGVAATQMAAQLLARTRPGVTVVAGRDMVAALALIPLGVLAKIDPQADTALTAIRHWGLRTIGELAALPPAEVAARLGAAGARWQAMAGGEDLRPLVPEVPEERFESMLELEWPIDALEPLSFVLTRLLEPLSTRLERRDRGAAALHLDLRLTTKDQHVRRLELPTPMREVRALRTLVLLDLESHPAPAPIDRVTLTIEPTPGRILQHTLFARPHPTPEQLSTLLARLGALMGENRVGAPETVDTYRPGAFAMIPFALEHPPSHAGALRASARQAAGRSMAENFSDPQPPTSSLQPPTPSLVSALRRCRQPVPARAAMDARGRPVRITTDRRGFPGGAVMSAAGPWRTSGAWWAADGAGEAGRAGGAGGDGGWDRDEWDVALSDGVMYRVFQDRASGGWFIDAVVD